MNDEKELAKKQRVVKLKIVERKKCNKLLNSSIEVTERMFCAGYKKKNKGACGGDSGSPIICEDKVFGIDSWRVGKCGEFPDVFTRIKTLRPWILEKTSITPGNCHKHTYLTA